MLGYGARIVSRTDRFGRILELLARDGSVSVGALAGDLGVSEATVRRDLQILGEQRLLERSHGGAVAHGTAHELPVRYRTGGARRSSGSRARRPSSSRRGPRSG